MIAKHHQILICENCISHVWFYKKNMCLLDVGMVMISIKLCEYTSLALLYCNGGHA